jgi:hypothetical protein
VENDNRSCGCDNRLWSSRSRWRLDIFPLGWFLIGLFALLLVLIGRIAFEISN